MFSTAQQVNTKVSVFGYHTILYFSILENTLCLYKFTFLKPSIMCPGFLVARQSEYNLKKMKVACPSFKYYALLPDTCNYVKIKFTMKESTTQRYHHWSSKPLLSSLFIMLAYWSLEITVCELVFLEWKEFGNLSFEKE